MSSQCQHGPQFISPRCIECRLADALAENSQLLLRFSNAEDLLRRAQIMVGVEWKRSDVDDWTADYASWKTRHQASDPKGGT